MSESRRAKIVGAIVSDAVGKMNQEGDVMADTNVDDIDALFSKRPFPQSPLGIESRQFWEDRTRDERRANLLAAIVRYVEGGRQVPEEWLREMKDWNRFYPE